MRRDYPCRLCHAPRPERVPDHRGIPVLLLVPAPPAVRAPRVSLGRRRLDPIPAALGLDLQSPLLPRDPLHELGRDVGAAVHPPGHELSGPPRIPDGLLPRL